MPAPPPPRYADLLARLDTAAGALGVDMGLDRVRRALARLGDPQRRYLTLQIAGTNGKGSTAAMAEAILRRAGLRTGLYTSPHLARFTERIRVDGREVDGDRLAALDVQVQASGERLTYFEIATVLGFLAFAEAGVDVAVLETGLGGRLDAVTCCEPLATAITSIGIDHTEYLGPTIADIAREKAGILKPAIPCFVGRVSGEAADVIAARAAQIGAPLRWLDTDFSAPAAHVGLAGPHQTDNAAIAVALAEAVAACVGRPLDAAGAGTIAAALAGVRWPGRLERLAEDLWIDCAHNAQGARALAAALTEIAAGRPVTLLMSVARDKDVDAMLAALAPVARRLIATGNDSPRALPAGDLAARARARFAEVTAIADPEAALARARAAGDVVVVCGSIFLVGPLRARLLGEPVDPRRTSDPLRLPDPLRPR
ncbi:MAG TPA: Mur ligase family protein [Polyangia bacterium]|nr:Mur ligase family protein [Polyangia bacterium]